MQTQGAPVAMPMAMPDGCQAHQLTLAAGGLAGQRPGSCFLLDSSVCRLRLDAGLAVCRRLSCCLHPALDESKLVIAWVWPAAGLLCPAAGEGEVSLFTVTPLHDFACTQTPAGGLV